MSDLYFVISKVAGFCLEPLHLVAFLIAGATTTAWMGRLRATQFWLSVALATTVLIGAVPLWNRALYALETQVIYAAPTEPVAGIIVLGGALGSGFITEAHGHVPLNSAAERMTTAITLMQQYPEVPVVFSGFSGAVVRASLSESDLALRFINEVTGSTERLILEDRSRNTVENAKYTRELTDFAGNGSWLLVTSAYHMPRALEIFTTEGMTVVPYPTDFRSRRPREEWRWHLFDGAEHASILVHEWVGTQVYRWVQSPK